MVQYTKLNVVNLTFTEIPIFIISSISECYKERLADLGLRLTSNHEGY